MSDLRGKAAEEANRRNAAEDLLRTVEEERDQLLAAADAEYAPKIKQLELELEEAREERPHPPALDPEDRERLGKLADRIANDIEDDWPHAEEMRGYVRLLRNLASHQGGGEQVQQLEAELAKAREQTEAMAWAAGWETDGAPPFEFEAARKQILEMGHEDARDREEEMQRRAKAVELLQARIAEADEFNRDPERAFLDLVLAALHPEGQVER